MNHFSDYTSGRATAEYMAMVDQAHEIAENQKKRVDSIHHEKIDYYVDLYARKLAENLNAAARDTRAIIERLRAGGMVICSSNAGRFFPETRNELELYVLRIQSSVRAECVALAPARRLLREWQASNHG